MLRSRTRTTRLRFFLIPLAAAGCASYGSHLTATPTARGETEYSVNVDGLVLDRGFGPQFLPNPEVAIRRGLARDLDLGLRVNALGGEASSRIGVLGLGRYRLTSVPLLGGGFVPATNQDTGLATTTAGMVLLSGITAGSRSEVVLGLRGQARLDLNAVAVQEDFDAATWRFVPGGSLGMRFPVNPRLFVFPELVVVVPYELEGKGWEFPIVQVGVAIQWGSRSEKPRAQSPP